MFLSFIGDENIFVESIKFLLDRLSIIGSKGEDRSGRPPIVSGWGMNSLCPSVCPSVYLSRRGWEGDDNGVVTARREYPGGRDNFNDKTERGIACNFEISKCRMGRNILSSFFDRCVEFWKVRRWKGRGEYKKVNAGFFFSSDIDTFPFFLNNKGTFTMEEAKIENWAKMMDGFPFDSFCELSFV